MAKADKQIIAMSAPVEITAAKDDGGPARFSMIAYTGGELELPNFDMPVVVDLQGAKFHKSVKANLNHNRERMVGHVDVTDIQDGKRIHMAGAISAGGADAEQVIKAHAKGYPWEASIQANRLKLEILAKGKTAIVNGQEFTGPKYIARQSNIYAVAFCDQGADDNTTVTIAASAASKKEKVMKPEVQAWAESMGIDIESASADQVAVIEANYEGKSGKKGAAVKGSTPFETRKIEARRRNEIRDIADKFIERREDDLESIEAIEKMHDHAIEAKMSAQEFRTEMYEAMVPLAHTVPTPRKHDRGLNARVLEAALCSTGRLSTLEDTFTDQELQAAHDRFPDGIGLNQLFIMAAEANGYKGGTTGGRVTLDIQRAAFGMAGPQIRATGFSMIDVPTIVSATANKFLREGWNTVDQTPMRLASIRSVRNFQQITTVSLTGSLLFEKLGADGEIKHGTLGEETYNNQVDTYARMLAITRKDLINDDLNALTAVPRKLGRGGALKLLDLFWTKFLAAESDGFISAGNLNLNDGVADMTSGGLAASEAMFMSQLDPDGLPLGVMPKILVVPTALHTAARTLMTSERVKGDADGPDGNPWMGRFRVESSPYMHNSSYTGFSATKWYMMADPADLPFIEIAALNGRVEPIVETADADFYQLGVQMRGYSDVGVAIQEYRAIVKNDGGTS